MKVQITTSITMNVFDDFSFEDIQRIVKEEDSRIWGAFEETYKDCCTPSNFDINLSVKEI